MQLFGLADCNNFFCSCERVFHPELRNVPVVVLVFAITEKHKMAIVICRIVFSVIKIVQRLQPILVSLEVFVIMEIHKMSCVVPMIVLFVKRIVQHPSHNVVTTVMKNVPVWRNRGRFCRWTLKGWVFPTFFGAPTDARPDRV